MGVMCGCDVHVYGTSKLVLELQVEKSTMASSILSNTLNVLKIYA